MTNLTISDQSYNEIITEIGYPVLSIDALESDIEMTKDQIIKLCILPAVREFYRFCPLVKHYEYSVSSTFTIDFPTDETFGVVHASLNSLANSITGSNSNAFINSRYYSSQSNFGGGSKYGPYSYNNGRAQRMERIETQSIIDTNKSFRVNVDKINRVVTGYSNITGKLLIDFCEYSEDFDSINFSDKSLILRLSTANVLRKLGMIRSLQNSDVPNSFNTDIMMSESDKMRDEVMETLRERAKVVIQKG